jgi:hypothetical protein
MVWQRVFNLLSYEGYSEASLRLIDNISHVRMVRIGYRDMPARVPA